MPAAAGRAGCRCSACSCGGYEAPFEPAAAAASPVRRARRFFLPTGLSRLRRCICSQSGKDTANAGFFGQHTSSRRLCQLHQVRRSSRRIRVPAGLMVVPLRPFPAVPSTFSVPLPASALDTGDRPGPRPPRGLRSGSPCWVWRRAVCQYWPPWCRAAGARSSGPEGSPEMIVVFGSINLDLIFPLPAIPRGRRDFARAPGVRIEPGGKGANQAVAAARDGAQVVMAGAVGGMRWLQARWRCCGRPGSTCHG